MVVRGIKNREIGNSLEQSETWKFCGVARETRTQQPAIPMDIISFKNPDNFSFKNHCFLQ